LLHKVLPATILKENIPSEIIFQLIAIVVTLSGVYTGYELYYRNKAAVEQWKQSDYNRAIYNFLYKGWGFDQLYNLVFVRPFLFITSINKADLFDRIYQGIALGSRRLNEWISVSQNGSLRWYVAGVLFGILFILTLQLFL
jgi:NADH-quinone oxidoreductase subunit L